MLMLNQSSASLPAIATGTSTGIHVERQVKKFDIVNLGVSLAMYVKQKY